MSDGDVGGSAADIAAFAMSVDELRGGLRCSPTASVSSSAAPIAAVQELVNVTAPNLQRELGRLRMEYCELEAESAERDAGESLQLHDARLQRLKLAGQLERYKDRRKPSGTPCLKDLTQRYEADIADLMDEVLRLHEENASLTSRGADDAEFASQVFGTAPPGVRTASEELCDDVCRLRRRKAECQRRDRETQVEDVRLSSLRVEAQRILKQLKLQERQLQELQGRKAKAAQYLGEVTEAKSLCQMELERERAAIRDLNVQATGLREACYLPARLKRESSFLVRMLDQEGGRLKTRRNLQSLEVCKKLYDEVAAKAPSLLPLAGRARSEMEAVFSRYVKLEEHHGRALQRLHLAVTRGLLPRDVGDGRSALF